MKLRNFILILPLLFISINMFSQDDSLRDQILDYKNSSYDFLNKGRHMLTDELNKSDLLKVMDIKNLLLEENNGNVYNTFYPIEYIFILYWTEEHSALIDFLKQLDYRAPVSNYVKIVAQTDNLLPTLLQKTLDNKDVVQMFINEAQISDMDKEFLLLQLEDIIRAGTSIGGLDLDSDETKHINDMSDAFLEKYPDSPYDSIIRENIRFKFEPSPWAFYWDFLSFGSTLVSGNLADSFNSGLGVEMAFDARYKKLMSLIGFDISIHQPKNNMEINGATWRKETRGDITSGYLSLGYLLIDNKKCSMYPYFGPVFSGIYISDTYVTRENPELKKLGLNDIGMQLGIGFDIKFNLIDPFMYGTMHNVYTENSKVSIRYTIRKIDYTKLGANLPDMDGLMHKITISWGIGGRKLKRMK